MYSQFHVSAPLLTSRLALYYIKKGMEYLEFYTEYRKRNTIFTLCSSFFSSRVSACYRVTSLLLFSFYVDMFAETEFQIN